MIHTPLGIFKYYKLNNWHYFRHHWHHRTVLFLWNLIFCLIFLKKAKLVGFTNCSSSGNTLNRSKSSSNWIESHKQQQYYWKNDKAIEIKNTLISNHSKTKVKRLLELNDLGWIFDHKSKLWIYWPYYALEFQYNVP